jgi:Ca2+-binding EF-hand superfamily protein
MLVALQKCDQETIDELRFIFHSFDKNGNGLLEKSDLIEITARNAYVRQQSNASTSERSSVNHDTTDHVVV